VSGFDPAIRGLNLGYEMALYRVSGLSFEVGGLIIRPTHEAVSLLLFLAGLLVLSAPRRMMPAWAKMTLVAALALVLVRGVLPGLASLLAQFLATFPRAFPGWLRQPVEAIVLALVIVPPKLLVAIPAAATALSWRRKDRSGWAWTEWIAAGVALLMALGWLSGLVLAQVVPGIAGTGWVSLPDLGLHWLFAAYLVGGILALRFGPSWDRWLEPGPSGGHPIPEH
jgi:hypothetical protein